MAVLIGITDAHTRAILKLYAAGVAASVLILAGAASILSRRFYGYACFSTVAAMLNLSNCCCIMGLPIGVWTLIVLLNPDVRRLYRRGGPTADPDSGRAGVGDL